MNTKLPVGVSKGREPAHETGLFRRTRKVSSEKVWRRPIAQLDSLAPKQLPINSDYHRLLAEIPAKSVHTQSFCNKTLLSDFILPLFSSIPLGPL